MDIGNLIAIIITFGVIVFVHEFGHFIFAKMNGIKVNEFSIGMGPSVATWTRGETDYSIRALPIGGYCLMEGMNEESDNKNAYNKKSVLARLSVSLAGPLFNFILAFLFAIVISHFYSIDPPVLTEIIPNSAASEAGFEVGDKIVALDGKKIYNYREIHLYSMMNSPEKPVEITYQRDGQEHVVTLTRKKDPETGNYLFGFYSVGRRASGFGEEIEYAALEVRLEIKMTLESVKMIFTGKASKDSLMGPVGIGSTMNDIIEEAKENSAEQTAWARFIVVVLNVINFAVLLSANLGVMNLLPIPALDGGKVRLLLIEGISGKPVPPEKEMILALPVAVLHNFMAASVASVPLGEQN